MCKKGYTMNAAGVCVKTYTQLPNCAYASENL